MLVISCDPRRASVGAGASAGRTAGLVALLYGLLCWSDILWHIPGTNLTWCYPAYPRADIMDVHIGEKCGRAVREDAQ